MCAAMGTLSGGQLRVLPSDGMGISCPASEPARPSLLPKFSSGTVVPLRLVDWGLDFQQRPGILADEERPAQPPFDRIRQGVNTRFFGHDAAALFNRRLHDSAHSNDLQVSPPRETTRSDTGKSSFYPALVLVTFWNEATGKEK